MKKSVLVCLVLVLFFSIPAFGDDKQVQGQYGTDVRAYAMDAYGTMTLLLYNYIPQRFPQSVVRGFNLGTLIAYGPEMDVWIAPSGSNIWIVLYSAGFSHCAVLIGDFGF